MLQILDENDTPILDEYGKPIEYKVNYIETNDWYKHKEPIHINNNGHYDTENRHLIVKEGIDDDHAVSKKQLDEINNNIYSKQDIDNKLLALENKITASINSLKSQINGYNKMNNHMPSNFNSNR